MKFTTSRVVKAIGFGIGAGAFVYSAAKAYSAWRWHVPPADEAVIRGLSNIVDEGIGSPDDDEFVEGGIFGNLFGDAGPQDNDPEFAAVAAHKGWRRERVKWVVRAALAAKVKFGTLPDTPPNREMLSDYIRKLMVEHGVRPSHISQQYPLAVGLALLPSDTDVMLTRMMSTGHAESRNRDYSANWWHTDLTVHVERLLFGLRQNVA